MFHLKLHTQNLVFQFLLIIGVATLIPKVMDPHLVSGQVEKQTFAAEMSQSYARGQTYWIYPLRHFLEVEQNDVVPWAEEVPLYSFTTGFLSRILPIPMVVIGRLLSFSFFLFLLYGTFRIGRLLALKGVSLWIFPAVIVWFPGFRIYSFSFMPDIPMTALSLWALAFAHEGKWKRSALSIGVSALFKYFAFFMALGLMAIALKKTWNQTLREKLKPLLFFSLCIFPSIAYILLFLVLKIPNPITEYRSLDGHGHMTSLEWFLNLKFYSRVFTWIGIKNPSIPGTLLALIGCYVALTKKIQMRKFQWHYPAIALIGFMFVFAPSYFVHDYYSLQFTLLTAIFSAIGLGWLLTHSKKRVTWVGALIFFCLIVAGFLMTQSATIPQNHYLLAAEKIKSLSKPNDRIFVLTSLSSPPLLFHSGRLGWMVNTKQWDSATLRASIVNQRLSDPRIQFVAVYLADPWADGEWLELKKKLEVLGWNSLIHQDYFLDSHQKIPSTQLWWLARSKE